MSTVNMHEAKTQLSKLVEAVENGRESEVIISRNGKPAAKLVPVDSAPKKRRPIGLHDGKYPDMSLEELNADDEEIAALFYGGDLPAVVTKARRR